MPVKGSYELFESLGSGGMGQVYRARDTRLNRIVAVKVLKADRVCTEEQRRRFLQEAQAASALNHPNIVTIHDLVSEDGRELMVMECVVGKNLRDIIPPGGLAPNQLINYGLQITDALMTAHNAGIIHRDLKPSNIMVTDRGLIKILDFGLAKLPGGLICDDQEGTRSGIAPLTVEGTLLGTVAYMSPEQAEGRPVDARSDIFSLGAVLYEMATGVPAFDRGNTIGTLTAVLRDEARPIAELAPNLAPELRALIERCLRKNPDERWQSTADIYHEFVRLKQASDSGTLERPRIGSLSPARHSSKRAAALAALIFVPLLLAGIAIWWFTTPRPQGRASAAQTSNVLHNDDIVQMVKAHVPEEMIVAQIKNSPGEYNLSPGELARLAQAGLTANEMLAMRRDSSSTAEPNKPSALPALPTGPEEQPAPPAAVPAAPPATPVARSLLLGDGTPVRLRLTEDVPADVQEDTPLHFVAASPVDIDGVTVIEEGAPATGTIAEVKKRKLFGHTRVSYELGTIQTVDGQHVPLRATRSRQGQQEAKRVFDSTKSKDLAAEKGARIMGYIDGDRSVTVKQ